MAVARLGYDIDSSGAVTAATNLDKMAVAAGKADKISDQLKLSFGQMAGEIRAMTSTLNTTLTSMGKFQGSAGLAEKAVENNTLAINELRSALSSMVSQGVQPAKQETDELGASLDALRAKYNPLYAASKKYETALDEIARAEKLGAITSQQAAQARELAANKMSASAGKAEAGAVRMGAGTNALNKSVSKTNVNMRMLVPQLSQVGQQFTATGQLGQALAVQAADIGLAFGVVGTVIGTLVGVALPSLIGGLGDSRDAADELRKDIDSLTGAIEDYKAASVSGIEATQYLVENFGAFNEQAVDLAERIQDLRLTEIMLSAAEASDQLANSLSGGFRSELARIEDLLGDNWLDDESQQAKALAGAFEDIRLADGPEAQLEAVRAMGQQFIGIVGSVSDMNAEQRAFYGQIVQTERALTNVVNLHSDANAELEKEKYLIEQANLFLEAQQRIRAENGKRMQEMLDLEAKLTEELGLGAVEALKLAGIDLENLNDAEKAAASMAAALGIAYDAAYGLANMDFGNLGALSGLSGAELLPGYEPPKKKRGGGGSRVDEYARDLEALQKSLQTERETLDIWYAENQEILSNRRALEILGIEEHNEAKLRLEAEYNEQLRQLQEEQYRGVADAQAAAKGVALDFLGTLANQSKGAAKALLVVNTALSISEAIQNTAAAATKALAIYGPTPQGFAAAARVKAFGAAQVGLIAANGVLKLGQTGGGSGGGGVGSASSSGVTAGSTAPPAPQEARIIVQGDELVSIGFVDKIIKEVQNQSKNGTIITGVSQG